MDMEKSEKFFCAWKTKAVVLTGVVNEIRVKGHSKGRKT